MTWRDLIGRLISDNMLSVNAFAKKCYLHHTTVLNLLSDKNSTMQLRTKNNIEKAFNIKVDDSDPENLIVTSLATGVGNGLVVGYDSDSNGKGNYLLGTVTAGRGDVLNFDEAILEKLEYSIDTCFWYVIDKQNGDSMYPFLVENDKILVDRTYPRKLIKETDMVLVQFSGKGAVKFFSRSEDDANMLVFYSSNGAVAPMILRKENCEYFKVVLIKKV